uniref:Putative secreted protein n=1 Tax=Ixodes ricinus TaxID=34613 RepID=A0A6B0UNK1_IXORI
MMRLDNSLASLKLRSISLLCWIMSLADWAVSRILRTQSCISSLDSAAISMGTSCVGDTIRNTHSRPRPGQLCRMSTVQPAMSMLPFCRVPSGIASPDPSSEASCVSRTSTKLAGNQWWRLPP